MPLVEVPGNGLAAPAQTEIGLKVGVVGAVTLTVKVVVTAHCPAFGVKV